MEMKATIYERLVSGRSRFGMNRLEAILLPSRIGRGGCSQQEGRGKPLAMLLLPVVSRPFTRMRRPSIGLLCPLVRTAVMSWTCGCWLSVFMGPAVA